MSEEPPAKLRKTEADPSSEADRFDIDSDTQKALEEIDALQNDIDTLNEKASEEILQVEQKYNKLRKPYFDKRNTMIEKVPNFWVTAFVNHPQISAVLDEEEEDCLHYLNKVEVEEFEDIKSGYKLKFSFKKDNPFFENEELCKEFHLVNSGDPASKSEKIRWKDGKDLVKKAMDKMVNGAKNKYGYTRTFFQWYCDNTEPSADDIAEVIKDDMWPNPLQYYLAPDVSMDENGVDDEDDEDDEDDDSVVEVDEDGEGEDETLDDEEDGEDEDGELDGEEGEEDEEGDEEEA